MEQEIEKVIREIEDYGGAVKAIEEGYLQMRTAQRARLRKQASDRGEQVIVGENYFRGADDKNDVGDVFRLNPQSAKRVLEKYERAKAQRDHAAVARTLERLAAAASDDSENLLPYLIECCHAYATIGEMVAALKQQWGEFDEPVRF
jgi:methylmalonyl-CoA mutase N-terminal domain/subunit